jgi:hypothetical protein
MARSSECTDSYAQKVLDAADIVREAIFQQLSGFAGTRGYFPLSSSRQCHWPSARFS